MLKNYKTFKKFRYLSLEKRQEIIDDSRLKQYCNNGISKNHKSFKKFPQKIDSETVTKENDKEMPKEVSKKKDTCFQKKDRQLLTI